MADEGRDDDRHDDRHDDSTPDPPATAVVAGLVRRVRRMAGLLQRELAASLGVSQSRVARWETGRSRATGDDLERMGALAGLRLALVDEARTPVTPMREDAARDVLGRRMPAHVEAMRAQWWVPRDSSTTSQGWQELRRSQEQGRAVAALARHPIVPSAGDRRHDDHPTLARLLDELARGVVVVVPRDGDDGAGTQG